jgi:DNA-binding NarL/FixJ family response regulator
MREGLRAPLCSTGEFEIVGEASDGASTLALAGSTDAVLLTLGLSMPGIHGLDLIPLIKHANPSLRILVVTMHPEQAHAVPAFKAGASGYLTKKTPGVVFIAAARKVASGGVYVSLEMADQIASGFNEVDALLPHQSLSSGEFDIFLRIASGDSVTAIAEHLNLSTKTGFPRTCIGCNRLKAASATSSIWAERPPFYEERTIPITRATIGGWRKSSTMWCSRTRKTPQLSDCWQTLTSNWVTSPDQRPGETFI